MSTADRRMIVLRNGIMIGASPFSLEGEIQETAAYMLARVDQEGRHWLRIPLPGQDVASGEVPRAQHRNLKAPAAFRAALAEILQPGTTVVITRDSLAKSASGRQFDIIASEEHP
jgi:hypothetical protein